MCVKRLLLNLNDMVMEKSQGMTSQSRLANVGLLSVSLWNMQESGSDEDCSEESSSSAEEEDAEFSANEEDGKRNPNSSYGGGQKS